MSPKSRRRRGSEQEHRDAASEHSKHSTARPTREDALDALCILLAYAGGQRAEPHIYTQHDLPPDVTSADAYARRHRALRAAGVEGVWTRGKTLACTPDAWATELARAPSLRVVADSSRDVDAEIDAALGIRTRGSR